MSRSRDSRGGGKPDVAPLQLLLAEHPCRHRDHPCARAKPTPTAKKDSATDAASLRTTQLMRRPMPGAAVIWHYGAMPFTLHAATALRKIPRVGPLVG